MDPELKKILKQADEGSPVAKPPGPELAEPEPTMSIQESSKASPLGAIKKGYFFLEDCYYELLDRINKVVPIYKVVDPIDKVVPSFPLFVGLIALVIVFFMFVSFSAPAMIATLHVVDSEGHSLEGVAIELALENQKVELLTDKWGEATTELASDEAEARASLSKEGFQGLEREILLEADETTSLTMQPAKKISFEPEDAEKTVKVIDGSTNRLLAKKVILTFQCQPQGSSPPSQTGSTGEFYITHPRNCDTLSATAESDGYSKKSKTLGSKVNYINLTPNVTKTTGDISVIVKDSGQKPEPDVVVRAIDEATSLEAATSSTGTAGSALLENLNPGRYTVSALSPDGRAGQATGISLLAGETEVVNITLPTEDEVNSRKIYIKIVEKGTQKAIENTQAFIYDANTLIDSTSSNSKGIVEKKLAEPKPRYMLVFTHPEFVTTIEPSISPKDLSATEPITVLMARATTEQPNPTSGEITATVVDEALMPVEGALVTVYNSLFPDIPLKTPPGKTLEDGSYTFSNLAPGNYLVKARSGEGSAEGASEEFRLDAGQSLDVQLVLVLGQGTIQATVFDQEAALKDPVPSAEVKFIDASDGKTVLSSCTTDTSGECESGTIAADRFVYVSASAPGFLPKYAASTVDVVNSSRANVEIGLIRESNIPAAAGKIDTRFRFFCDDVDCENPADVIQSDPAGTKTYYALFEMLVTEDGLYSNPVHHIRIGPDSEIQLPLPNDYKAKIRSVSGPLFSHAILSTCWNNDSANPFMDPESCASLWDSKQVNVYYPSLIGKQVIPVVVEFVVEQGLADGTRLEFHFKAKAISESDEVATEEKVKYFLVNEALCDGKNFAWSFALDDGQGNTSLLGSDPENPHTVTLNQPYGLTYTVYNCSGRGYSNASITAENKPLALEVISLTQDQPYDFGPSNAYLEESFSFPADREISHTLPVFVASEAQLAELEFKLVSGPQSSTELIPFSVSSQNLLSLEHQPSRLSPQGSPSLTGKVSDNSSATPLENVLVSLNISEGNTLTAQTDALGLFSINGITGLEGIANVTLTLRKAGYRTLEKQIEVGTSPVIPDPSLDCITVERPGLTSTDIFFVKNGSGSETQADFTVINSCQDDVIVLLESELEISTLKQFRLDAGETYDVTVNAVTDPNSGYEIAIGEYGIGVKAMYASDDPLSGFRGPLHIVRAYVTDPNSCFRLADPAEPSNPNKMKSSFDIKSGLDDGLIINDCFVFFEDLRLPSVEKVAEFSPVEEAYSLLHSSPTQPAEAKVKKKVFDPSANNFDQSGALEFKVTDSGGYVFVDWVDFFMTDKNHNGGDRHAVFAQTHKGAWSNITAQLPYTDSIRPEGAVCGTGCDPGAWKCVIECRDPHVLGMPVIDNLGWVDTETYYPPDSLFDDEVTSQPIWQGQHSVCNSNLGGFDDPFVPCSISDYFAGVSLTSYNVGMIANKISLQAKQDYGTEISGLRWQYTSTDKSHNGNIDFKVRNNTLMGESYALIEVEDTTARDFTPVQDDVTVDWILSKRGVRFKSNPMLQVDSTITLRPGQVIGITVDQSEATKHYVGWSLGQVSANLAEPQVPKELSRLTFTPNESTGRFCWEDGEYISTYVFFNGQWSPAIDEFDFDPEEPLADHVFSFSQSTSAKLVAYRNDSEQDVVLNKVQIVHITKEIDQVEVERGFIGLSAATGEDRAEATPNPMLDQLNPLPGSGYDSIEYAVETVTPESLVFFSTGSTTVADPYVNGITVVATISSIEEGATTQKERFHIRLVGQPQSQCLGYDGLSGSTGPGSKPRILFDWEWDSIDMDSCGSENLDYIYCDPTQFTISLIKRIEEIARLAEEFYAGQDPENDNILQARELQVFSAYLVEDAYVQDFRDDFVDFFGSDLLAVDLMSGEYPWGHYLKDSERLVFDTSQARFASDTQASPDEKLVAAGLHDVFIDLQFDRDQFDFFYTQGENVDLRANITVYIAKLSDPVIKSPFYYLPFNGKVGLEGGEFNRNGYGLVFNNSSGPLALVSDSVGGTFYTTDSPGDSTARKLVGTVKESSFESINFDNRGKIMKVSQDQSQIDFMPSIATPVLLEMAPENNLVEAYYNIRDQKGGLVSSPASFMNLWTGAGSTMRSSGGACADFYGSKLEYRRQDSLPASGSCASLINGSYGFKYDPASDSDRLYFETVFYSPFDYKNPAVITLRKSCDNASAFYAPGSTAIQKTDTTSTPVSLSIPDSKTKIATMQDVIDLVGQEYVCISSDDQEFSFWWNPQKVISELDSAKTQINSDWDHGVKCEVAATRQ